MFQVPDEESEDDQDDQDDQENESDDELNFLSPSTKKKVVMLPDSQKKVVAGFMAKAAQAAKRRRVESEDEDEVDPYQDSPRRGFEPSQQSQRRRSAMSPLRPATFPPTSSPPQQSSPVSNLDSMIAIKDGGELQVTKERKERSKRKRFMISNGNLSKDDREQWSLLCEAVRMDYVQRGPDPRYESSAERSAHADDSESSAAIIFRHRDMFGPDAPKLDDIQMTYVPS